jgi:hypothetical protein
VNVGAIGPVAHGGWLAYTALSPYLNGVQRIPDAAAEPLKAATASASVAVAENAPTSSSVVAAPPFLNPAIGHIAARAALAPVFIVSAAPQDVSPTDAVLYGDSGFLIQAYGAVALLTGPVALTPVYGLPTAPAIPAVAPITPVRPVGPRMLRSPHGLGGDALR